MLKKVWFWQVLRGDHCFGCDRNSGSQATQPSSLVVESGEGF
jgi:hypothetical protein